MTNNIQRGKTQLEEWAKFLPNNFYTTDTNLNRTLTFHLGEEKMREHVAHFYKFGRIVAVEIDPLVRDANLPEHLPQLERFDGLGRRTETVAIHPSHDEAGRLIYGSEMLSVLAEQGNNLAALGLFYLSAQNGESGHNVAVASTAGLIKVLQAVGTEPQKLSYLSRLLDADYAQNFTGAHFFTEVQGGSDVEGNGTRALLVDAEDGIWELKGEKWFCANISADIALVTAHIPNDETERGNLGLFLLPRLLEDGTPNGIFIQQLKDTLGTRSLATAEVRLDGAIAYQVGNASDGYANISQFVQPMSLLYAALACAGAARRAYITAVSYAMIRSSFGNPIIHYPLIMENLAKMRADSVAALSGSLFVARQLDKLETGEGNAELKQIVSLVGKLNKMRTADLAQDVVHRGIDVLGGNGTVESFSILPRLLRDTVAYASWAGTHNVLLGQIQTAMRDSAIHKPFIALIQTMLSVSLSDTLKKDGVAELTKIGEEIEYVLETMNPLTSTLYLKPLFKRLTDIFYVSAMSAEAGWEMNRKNDRVKQRVAEFYFETRVMGRDAKDIKYYDDMVARLCRDVGGYSPEIDIDKNKFE